MQLVLSGFPRFIISLCILLLFSAFTSFAATNWNGVLRNAAGKPVAGAKITLRAEAGNWVYEATSAADGTFAMAGVEPTTYALTVESGGKMWSATKVSVVESQGGPRVELTLSGQNQAVAVVVPGQAANMTKGSGGEKLTSEEVAGLPLNERDFSKLLLLAAGTMTDTNGAANFTQQFAVNGQRGVASVFAMDSATTTDPEMGGATFSTFNVDAIQEVQSSSGVMLPEIGRGAASFTNVVTKSGTNAIHGSLFEFFRNAALDARNYFDRVELNGRRIPPFNRNEFGGTVGGPVVLPGYDGRNRTYFFGQYQGFRQVLGTTQVLSVPTSAERQGIDTTSVPEDTLMVPVNPAIKPILNAYPLPN